MRQAIRLGVLQPGDQLPTVKAVVGTLAINPNTVLKAYRQLEIEGLVEGRPGIGTFVQRTLAGPTLPSHGALRTRLLDWLNDALEAGLEDEEIVALRASGISPERLLRPVLFLSMVACAITFYVVAVALPAANQSYRELVFSLVVSKARTGMAPRVFNDDLIPGIVIYVSDMPAAQNGQWKDVFMYDDRDKRRPSVISCSSYPR